MGKDEDRRVVGRVASPPTLPAVVRPGSTHGSEHVAAQDTRADILEAARGEIVVGARRATLFARNLLKRSGSHEPVVQFLTADAQRIGLILDRPGAVTVKRNAEVVNP